MFGVTKVDLGSTTCMVQDMKELVKRVGEWMGLYCVYRGSGGGYDGYLTRGR